MFTGMQILEVSKVSERSSANILGPLIICLVSPIRKHVSLLRDVTTVRVLLLLNDIVSLFNRELMPRYYDFEFTRVHTTVRNCGLR